MVKARQDAKDAVPIAETIDDGMTGGPDDATGPRSGRSKRVRRASRAAVRAADVAARARKDAARALRQSEKAARRAAKASLKAETAAARVRELVTRDAERLAAGGDGKAKRRGKAAKVAGAAARGAGRVLGEVAGLVRHAAEPAAGVIVRRVAGDGRNGDGAPPASAAATATARDTVEEPAPDEPGSRA